MIIQVKLLGDDSCWLGGTSDNKGSETESSFRFGESEVRNGLEKINTFGEGGLSIGGRIVTVRHGAIKLVFFSANLVIRLIILISLEGGLWHILG